MAFIDTLPAAAATSSSCPANSGTVTFSSLPEEVQREILKHCSSRELCSLALVSAHFHSLASAFLYHTLNLSLPTESEPIAHRSRAFRKGLPDLLNTLTTSDYDYSRHIRHVGLGTICEMLFMRSHSPFRVTEFPSKTLNTLMVLAMRKAVGLESLSWDVNVEMSPALFKVLCNIDTLVELNVRLHHGPSAYRRRRVVPNNASGHLYPPVHQQTTPAMPLNAFHGDTPSQESSAVLSTNVPPLGNQGQGVPWTTQAGLVLQQMGHPNSTEKSSQTTTSPASAAPDRGQPTFSGFKNLQRLSVLDIEDLGVLPELQACVHNCARSLTHLSLSLSSNLTQKKRERVQHTVTTTAPHAATAATATTASATNNGNINNSNGTWDLMPQQVDNYLAYTTSGTPHSIWGGIGGTNSPLASPGPVVGGVDTGNVPNIMALASLANITHFGGAASTGPTLSASASTASTALAAAQKTKAFLMTKALRDQDKALAHIFGIEPDWSPEKESTKTATKKMQKKSADSNASESTSAAGSDDKGKGKAAEHDRETEEGKEQIKSTPIEPSDIVDALQAAAVELGGPHTDSASASSMADREAAALERFMELAKGYLASARPEATASSAPVESKPSTQATTVGEASASGSSSGSKPALDPTTPDDDTSLFGNGTVFTLPTRPLGTCVNRDVLPEDIDVEAPEGQLVLHPHDGPGDIDADESQAETEETVAEEESKQGASTSPTPMQKQSTSTGAGRLRNERPASLTSEAVANYARETRGLSLKKLSCYLIPVKASILGRAIDLLSLVSITLLSVGPQAAIWNLFSKENLAHKLPLRNIHTDSVSQPFLQCVAQLDKVERIYLLKRIGQGHLPENAAPTSSVTSAHIYENILQKHARTLRVLSVRDMTSEGWDLDDTAIRLLARRARNLQELAASMNMGSLHMLQRCLSGFRSLRALHVVRLRNDDTCVWVMQEVRHFLMDMLCHYPHLPLTYVATEGSHSIDRIVRVNKRAERKLHAPGPSGSTTAASTIASMRVPDAAEKEDDSDSGGEDGMFHMPEFRLESILMCHAVNTTIFTQEVLHGMI
ncbi:hypothetical protein HMPREF1624_04105 [Sporothrix schenckii ATCC 58251]|uniref:F-box domain-containing protein n=1 Tax=Sporothrix schenckii (strain ATCC 58251 / de Perez 2211183) TaxID=1391915 RepID=U7PTL7_SPOS1|nr:hypothetical protein HMPREF1624_04105 [Sporothrix schenckii ATCC 58251]